jgi:hypothetical protein
MIDGTTIVALAVIFGMVAIITSGRQGHPRAGSAGPDADVGRPRNARPYSRPDAESKPPPIKILFLAANPKGTDSLRLGEEIREIKGRLRLADLRDEFVVEQEWAVRVTDLQDHLLRHQPHIVHFSGHGSRAGEIILEDRPVSPAALQRLFATLKDNLRCVVLNTCYSEAQAGGIIESIDCVVGMTRAIPDESAIAFAAGFYQGLGFGRSIKTAFDMGCAQIDLEGVRGVAPRRDLIPFGPATPEDNPKLKVAPGVDVAKIFLVGGEGQYQPRRHS